MPKRPGDQSEDQSDKRHLELELGAEKVAFKHLIAASSIFAQLINEVARSYTGEPEPVIWFVELRPGSVRVPLRGEPASDRISPSLPPTLGEVVERGIAAVAARPERPDHFTDKALAQAKALANLASDDLPIFVRNGHDTTPVTREIAKNVEHVLGPLVESYGTVEGDLEGLDLHGPTPHFAIYQPLTGHRVECRLTGNVTVEDLRPAIGKRVGVRGRIWSHVAGDRVRIEAEDLMVFPDEDALPTPEDVLGILKGYE